MKYVILFLILFTNAVNFAQPTYQEAFLSADIFEFQGNINNTVKAQLTVPAGEVWLIFNSTDSRFEYASDDQFWHPLGQNLGDDYFFVPQDIHELAAPINAYKLAIITQDFNLEGGTLSLAEGIELRAAGGIFLNGTIIGNHGSIDDRVDLKLFDISVNFDGTWRETVWFKPEWYGANEESDDYLILKTVFEEWDLIHLKGEYEFNTDGQILLNGSERIVRIRGNGRIVNNSSIHITQPMIQVNNISRLEIDRLQIDGKFKANCGLYLKGCSAYIINNLNIQNFLNSGTGFSRAVGVRLDILKKTTLKGDNWVLKEFNGGADGLINSGLGVSRCLWILINYAGIPEDDGTVVEIDNSTFHWAYGDDGDILDVADQDYIEFAKHRFIFRNTEFKYFSRRASKGSACGIQYFNCEFDTADEVTLTAKMGGIAPQPSGYVNVRNANEAAYPNYRNSFGVIKQCTFNNSGNLTIGSGNQIIIENVNGVLIEENTLQNVNIVLNKHVSGCIIEENLIKNGNINVWSLIQWESDRSSICHNRVELDAEASSIGGFINANGDIHNINICSNSILTDETNLTLFLGLIRHLSGTGSSVDLLDNKLIRTNHQRTEIMHSLVDWDSSCLIENNDCNLSAGLGIYFNGGVNSAETSNNGYNLAGGVLPVRGSFN